MSELLLFALLGLLAAAAVLASFLVGLLILVLSACVAYAWRIRTPRHYLGR